MRVRRASGRAWSAVVVSAFAALGTGSVPETSSGAGDAGRPPPAFARVVPLTEERVAGRLRVFGVAGDPALVSEEAVAVVRRLDGWLTDFWTLRPRVPTVPQLGTTTDVDGLWQMHPVVVLGERAHPILASRVASLEDAVETEGTVEVAGVTYRAVTTHRLHGTRLRIVTRFAVVGGGPGGAVLLGDSLRWGNVAYWVEGLPRPRLKYEGPARWIGRRGAGGDLLLRTLGAAPMRVEYSARFRGSQGRIHALHRMSPLGPGEEATFERELSWEPLPIDRAPEVPGDAQGSLRVTVRDERGAPLPAKLRIDREGRKEPIFDDDGGLDGADRFAWTGSGVFERTLEPGAYRLLASAGLERDVATARVLIREGREVTRELTLPRVVETPGWVGADLHLHQAPSVDADIGLAERVISVAAEGVEVAVATDHYVVTDLMPTVRWLRSRGALVRDLQVIPGSEVSTLGRRFGHFNVFPLPLDRNVVYRDTTAGELFADARRVSPGGLIQVNHPRMDAALGYFTYFRVDERTGEPAEPGYDPRFDLLEVYNGDEGGDLRQVKKVFFDWLHLLQRGHRYTATGNSDSHKLAFLDPGLPRTLVRHGAGGSDGTDGEVPLPAFLEALRQGRAQVTSGPVLDVEVEGAGPGETARVAPGRVSLAVRVRAAPWIDVTRLEVFVGGDRPVVTVAVPRSRAVVRLERRFLLTVPASTFVVVAAEGERGLPTASLEGTRPFAFTNPIWLEVAR